MSVLALLLMGLGGYSLHAFDGGVWSGVFILLGALMIGSEFMPGMAKPATVVARVTGVVAMLAFALLMLAATIGGSFHLSESNQVIAWLLFGLGVVGSSAFGLRLKPRPVH